jgi:hypothetical protein
MKPATVVKHYLPCLYFISLSLCILFISNNNPLAIVTLILFSALLFTRHHYVRMAMGGLMLFLSLYFSLAWLDEVRDIRTAGGAPSAALRSAILYIAGAFCMAILLIIPLQLPRRAPLYNRK